MSKLSIVTLGCPKNAIDSEGLGGLLGAAGHEPSRIPTRADVVIVNTCGFIDPARRETVEEVLELADLKETQRSQGPRSSPAVWWRARPTSSTDSLPEVDAFVDFAAYPLVAEIVDGAAAGTLTKRIFRRPRHPLRPGLLGRDDRRGPRLRFGRAPWAY